MKPCFTPSLLRACARLLPLALVAALASCGGGSGSGSSSVNNITASGLAYGRTMTVTVTGAGLDDPSLFMTVDGPCESVQRSGTALDNQVQFACTVIGVGDLSPRIRRANGDELARVTVNVPLPRFALNVQQGARAGIMVLELDPRAAPVSVANFVRYANLGFYRDTLFHRVITGKIAQGGGYTTGPTLKPATSGPIVLESRNGLKNVRGTIAMARTSVPDSATSQFFFNISDNPEFDYVSESQPGYAVFGYLISGLDVLDEIGKVDTRVVDATLLNVPIPEVALTSVLQIR